MKNEIKNNFNSCYTLNYFQESWVELPSQDEKNISSGAVIIFELEDYPLDFYDTFLESKELITVTKGKSFKNVDKDHYSINPQSYDDYLLLFKDLSNKKINITAIVYLWLLNDAEYVNMNDFFSKRKELYVENIFKECITSVTQCFYFLKALVTSMIGQIDRILIYAFKQKDECNPFIDMVAPYGKSLRLLAPDLRSSFVYVNNIGQITDSIAKELSVLHTNTEVYYMKDNCLVKTYSAFEPSGLPKTKFEINSTVLITGGIGKLGLHFANYLYEKYKVNLVLVGHSDLNNEKALAITDLSNKGCHVIYEKADVTDFNSMKSVVEKADKYFGKIDTVIHAAGIVSDKVISIKDYNEFYNIISVKALGALVLDEVTKREPIKNFILFSSVSSIIGDFGQCDYSFGNRFLDCYREIRDHLVEKQIRQGESVVINWPLWKDGGMNQDVEAESLYLHTSGLDYLTVQDGIKIFEEVTNLNLGQGIVLYGETKRTKAILNSDVEISQEKKLEQVKLQKERKKMYSKNELLSLAAQILKNDIKDLDVNTNFGDMGFDSISLKVYARVISDKYNINITPAIFFSASNVKKLTSFLKEKFPINSKEDVLVESQDPYVERKINGMLTPLKILYPQLCNEKIRDVEEKEIAIIGINGKFPQSDNFTEYWKNLEEEKDLITEIPSNRWDWKQYYSSDRFAINKTVSRCGGFVNDVDKFDAKFFNISRMEAELMDPQQRFLLQGVWKAIEDSGYKASSMSGGKVGVFIGAQFNDYQELLHESGEIQPQLVTGNAEALLANKVSYYMNFLGPSETIDTACSSSLVAIHHAVQSIQRGESEIAIAGGISLMLSPKTFISASKLGVLSPDNHCKTFDKDADGYVRGEGMGIIVLKPLTKAIEDNDHIYAVIKGTAENHGGKANSLTAPNADAQASLIQHVYTEAGVDINTVSYIEAHGTGTELGDPIEIDGLKKAFSNLGCSVTEKQCGIGSVKTNIGHLEPAAGIAGLIKVVLAMKHRKIPASINLKELNPYIDLNDSPFYIVNKTKEWKTLVDKDGNVIPRRAGISSFGFGGTNAHIILEEYRSFKSKSTNSNVQIIILSAKDSDCLNEYAKSLYDFLVNEIQEALNLEDIAYTLQCGREVMEYRVAIIVRDINELCASLKAFIEGIELPNVLYNNTGEVNTASIILSDDDVKELVKKWLSKDELTKIAKLWTVGYDLNWQELWNKKNVKKISLPTYPFRKESYWFLKKQDKDDANKKSLLDSIDYDSILNGKLVFTKRIDLKNILVKDHVVNDANIFPGVGYIEMAYQAFSEVFKERYFTFEKVFWLRPLVITEATKIIKILLAKKSDNKMLFEVYDSEYSNNKLLVRGEVNVLDNITLSKCKIEIEEIITRCDREMNNSEIYRQYIQNGMNYGPYFRGIKRTYYNEAEVIGVIEIPETVMHEQDYTLNPSVIDSSLQTIGCIIGDKNRIYLPYSLKKMEILGPITSNMYSYAKRKGKNNYDVIITDNKGNICIKIYDYNFRENTNTTLGDTVQTSYFEQIWKKSNTDGKCCLITQPLLVIYNDCSCEIADMIVKEYTNSIRVKIGKKNEKISNSKWEIKADDKNAWLELVPFINTISEIYYLTGIQLCETCYENNDYIKRIQEEGVINLFRLIKILDNNHMLNTMKSLRIIINNTQRVANEKYIFPNSSSIYGFAKVMAKEYVNLNISMIDVDLLNTEKDLNSTLSPILYQNSGNNGELVVYRNENRFERLICELKTYKNSKNNFKEKGVYIVIGGLGGIGFILCKYLSATYKARIFIIGKSNLSKEKEIQLKQIEDKGGNVAYYKADINDCVQLQSAVCAAKKTYGNCINGVFHSAIVPLDRSIHNMTEEEFRGASDIKIYGSINIYSVFKNERLDFIAYFSSTSAQAGLPGQSNYVSGLNFMDDLAEYLQDKVEFPIKVINWGYWGIGSSSSGEFKRKMQLQGIYPISDEEGMEALEWIMGSEKSQILVLKSDSQLIKQLEKNDADVVNSNDREVENANENIHNEITCFVYNVIANILKCPIDSIDGSIEFEEMGIDSIIGFQIIAELEKRFPDLPATLLLDCKSIENLITFFTNRNIEEEQRQKKIDTDGYDNSIIDMRAELESEIKQIISLILKCEPVDFDNDTPFTEYGIDSIISFQIQAELEKVFGVLPATLLIDSENLNGVIDFLMNNKNTVLIGKCNENSYIDNSSNLQNYSVECATQNKIKNSIIEMESFLIDVEPGIMMEVSIKGTGEPLLLIPGIAVTSVINTYQFKELTSKFKVISINLPGHGKSDGIEDLTYKGISKILMKVISKLNIDKPLNLVGISYGGIIAQNIALEYPNSVKSLVLLGSITETKFEGISQIFSFTEAIAEDFKKVKFATSGERREEIDYCYEIYNQSQETNRLILLRYLEVMKMKMSIRSEINRINIPTLIIYGRLDTVVSPEESILLHSEIKNSKLVEIVDGGHFIHLTHHEEVNTAILNFLNITNKK